MHALVANLLDMARLQSGDTPLRLEWQSVEELVGAALAAMREPLAAHQVTVSSLSQLPLVECDGVLIERVLCNLLENAAKYTPAGSAIQLGATVQDKELRISVCDNGPGVPLAPNAGSSRNSLAANANPPRRAWAWAWRCAKPSSPPTMAASGSSTRRAGPAARNSSSRCRWANRPPSNPKLPESRHACSTTSPPCSSSRTTTTSGASCARPWKARAARSMRPTPSSAA